VNLFLFLTLFIFVENHLQKYYKIGGLLVRILFEFLGFFIIAKITSQNLVKQKKANKILLLLNCFSTVKFLKLKYFYTKNTMKNKKNLEINLSQFRV
jgi:hypothetical protein